MHEWQKPRSTQIDRHLIRIYDKTYPGESSCHTHASVSAFTLHVCVIRFARGQRPLFTKHGRVSGIILTSHHPMIRQSRAALSLIPPVKRMTSKKTRVEKTVVDDEHVRRDGRAREKSWWEGKKSSARTTDERLHKNDTEKKLAHTHVLLALLLSVQNILF